MKRHKGMRVRRTWIAAACAVFMLAASWPAGVSAKESDGAWSGTQADKAAALSEGAQERKELTRIRLSVGDGQDTPVFKAGEKASLQINV